MPRAGYRTERRQENVVDDFDRDKREGGDGENEGKVV